MRLAVAIPSPISTRAFRRVVRALCDKWGGTTSVIVPVDKALTFAPGTAAILQAFDPDIVYLYNASSGKSLQKARRGLDDFSSCPFWVVRFNDRLQGDIGWLPASVAEAGIDSSTITVEGPPGGSLTKVAVMGLSSKGTASSDPAAVILARRSAATEILVEGSPATAALDPFRRRGLSRLPFYYHPADRAEDALNLWNLRAVRGLSGHGGDGALQSALSRTPVRGIGRLEIIAGEPLSPVAQAAVAARGSQVRVTGVGKFRWPRRPNRTLALGRRGENDDMPVADGRFEFPVRRPSYAVPPGMAGSEPAGSYAVELDLQVGSGDDRLFGLPSRASLRNILMPLRWDERLSEQVRRLNVRSRVARDGSTVLAVRPARAVRSVALTIPTVTDVLNAVGQGARFELSDKGRFGQWTVNHLYGLEEIHTTLTDVRSRVLIGEFQLHHLGGPITGSYRRSMTLVEMGRQFTEARRGGDLPRRVPGGWTDDAWLRRWVSRLVEAGFLQLGMRVKCAECLAGSLIRVGEYGQSYFCPRCGLVTGTPALPEMAYQLNEAAHQFLSQRSDLTAMALVALRRRSVRSYTWGFDHVVRWKPTEINEFDFAVVADGRLMIGESKTGAKFTDAGLRTLVRLGKLLRPAVVVLSSDRECDGGCTPNCSRAIRPYWASSDSSLPAGTSSSPGPRERMEAARAELAKVNVRVVALCRGDLYAAFQRSNPRLVFV